MSSTKKQTAEKTYNERSRDVGALLGWIGEEIQMHRDFATKEGIGWGHAGDMGHYKEQLLEILVGLLGNDSERESRRMIEKALDDMRA